MTTNMHYDTKNTTANIGDFRDDLVGGSRKLHDKLHDNLHENLYINTHTFGCECDRCNISNLSLTGGGSGSKKSKKSKKKLTREITEENVNDHLYPNEPVSPFSGKLEDSPEAQYDDDLPQDYNGINDKNNKEQKGGGVTFVTGSEIFVGRSLAELKYNKTKLDYLTLKN
jgi:hypothetical protein